MNSGAREGLAVPPSYKTPAMLFIYTVKTDKSPGSDRGKINLHKKENIYCHLRYGYLVGVSVFPP